MKAILEFNLDDFDDRKAHKRSISATSAYKAIYDFSMLLRKYKKFNKNIDVGDTIALPEGFHTLTDKESEILSAFVHSLFNEFYETLEENKVDLEDL